MVITFVSICLFLSLYFSVIYIFTHLFIYLLFKILLRSFFLSSYLFPFAKFCLVSVMKRQYREEEKNLTVFKNVGPNAENKTHAYRILNPVHNWASVFNECNKLAVMNLKIKCKHKSLKRNYLNVTKTVKK